MVYKRHEKKRKNINQHKKTKRKPCLNMRRIDDFKYALTQILQEIEDKNYAQVKGSIYAKASKQDIREAKRYIGDKETEGVIPSETAKKLNRLLSKYSTYR
ncbi:MAG: hypothetical protein ACXQTP_01825 [Candidatus Methanofastidiosia archaeon]